jgi:HK97 family phage major capsid protein
MNEHIISLQHQIAEQTAGLKALVAKAEGENRDLDATEQAAFTKGETEVASLKKRLERAQSVERENATVVTPVLDPANPPTPAAPVRASVGDPNALANPGVPFGRFLAATVAAHRLKVEPAAWYKAKFGEADWVHAALTASDPLAGGLTIPQRLYATIVPLLQAAALMRRSGAAVEPLPNGQTTVVRATGGATFQRVAEGGEVNASGPTYGALTLTAKKMLGMIPISNDLITYSPQRIDQQASEQSVEGLRVAEDVDFLRGQGIGPNVKGLRYIATGSNLLTMTGTPDVAKIQNDLQRIVLALANANIAFRKPFWAFAPRTALYLQYLLNANGNRVFPSMDDGVLMGYPFGMTTSIPINLGGGTESEIYFWDAAECVIGDAENVRVDVSTEASYKDETGTLVSAFSKDQTVLRMILANDFGMFHDAGACVMTGVTWGV